MARSEAAPLTGVIDLHSRFIVGWVLSAVNDRHLTLSALDKTVKRRCPDAGCGRGAAGLRRTGYSVNLDPANTVYRPLLPIFPVAQV